MVTGRPAWWRLVAASLAMATGPTTPTWRGILVRRSATTSGARSAVGVRTTWVARADSRSGGWPSPTTTRPSTAFEGYGSPLILVTLNRVYGRQPSPERG